MLHGSMLTVVVMLGIVLIVVVVLSLFWGVVVSILHLEFFQALLLTLPLMLLVCLLGNEVQNMRPIRIYDQRKRDINWPGAAALASLLWWVACAFWWLVVAILRREVVLALLAMLMLWMVYPFLIYTMKDIRARRDGHDKE
jgi:hypothetical protein